MTLFLSLLAFSPFAAIGDDPPDSTSGKENQHWFDRGTKARYTVEDNILRERKQDDEIDKEQVTPSFAGDYNSEQSQGEDEWCNGLHHKNHEMRCISIWKTIDRKVRLLWYNLPCVDEVLS